MTDSEYKNLLDLVVKNGRIEIPSIYMFTDHGLELLEFLEKCKNEDCVIYFKNEDLTYDINAKDDYDRILANVYQLAIASKSLLKNYLKYLANIDDMTFDNILHS